MATGRGGVVVMIFPALSETTFLGDAGICETPALSETTFPDGPQENIAISQPPVLTSPRPPR